MASPNVIAFAKQAVEADQAGNIDRAIEMYSKTVEALLEDMKSRSLSKSQRDGFKARAMQYMKRAEELKAKRRKQNESDPFADLFPEAPTGSPGGRGAPPPPPGRSNGEEPSLPSDNVFDWESGDRAKHGSDERGSSDWDPFSQENLFSAESGHSGANGSGGSGGGGFGSGAAMGAGAMGAGLAALAASNPTEDQFEAARRAAEFARENPDQAKRAYQLAKKGGAVASSLDDRVRSTPGGFGAVMKTGAAGAAAGVVAGGVILGAPIIAGVAGLGGGIYAATRRGRDGERARAAGQSAHEAAQSAAEFNRRHGITDKATELAGDAWDGAKAADAKYDITGKTAQGIGVAWNATKTGAKAASDFNEKHGVTDKIAAGASSAWRSTKSAAQATAEWNRRHQVSRRIGEGIEDAYDGIKGLFSKK